jgi:hypothetical protein
LQNYIKLVKSHPSILKVAARFPNYPVIDMCDEIVYKTYTGDFECLGIGLIAEKDLPLETVRLLLAEYVKIHCVFAKVQAALELPEYSLQRHLVIIDAPVEVADIEFKMQELWGFEQSSKFHRFWLDIPGCICPRMDNRDLYGTHKRVISSSCPIHGDTPQVSVSSDPSLTKTA